MAIGAASLEQGVAALKACLGVEVPRGGSHPAMGTHNRLMQTGNGTYLEIIAIDQDAPTPGRARWFSLDDPRTQQRLAERPRPLLWVVGTDDLDAVVATSPVDLGEIVELARDDLTWRLTVPGDGHLPTEGLLPAFIEWPPDAAPTARQRDLGVRLQKIVLTHPRPSWLLAMLTALGAAHLVEVREGDPALAFILDAPRGRVTLSGRTSA